MKSGRSGRALLGASWVASALLLVLCVASCAPARPELVEVPSPPLDDLEPRVRDQLAAARRELQDALESPAMDPQQRGQAYGKAGMIYHAYDLREIAEACYLNAETLTPDDFRWPYYLGQLYRAAGEPESSMESLQRALALRPDDMAALLYLARAELQQNRHERAEELYRRALTVAPDSAAIHVGLGKIATARRDYAVAVEQFESALGIDPAATEVNYLLGLAYRNLGQRDRAAELLARRGDGRARIEDPLMARLDDLAVGWRIPLNRGISLFQAGHYELALAEFRTAAEGAPGDPIVRINLGSVHTQLGDLAAAESEFLTALEVDPHNAMAHFNLGTIAARAGDEPRAVEHYRAALESDPDYLNAHFNLANALRRTDRFEEASMHYRRVVEGDPGNPEARLAEALSLVRLHRYAEARTRLQQAIEAVPEYLPARHALVRVLAAAPEDVARDGAQALALAEALVAEERSLQHVVALAMAAAEVGDFEQAVRWQQAVIEAASAAGRADLVPELSANFARYRRGLPCRMPWSDDDPAVSPGLVRPK